MFTFFNDPGHGWLQVRGSDLQDLGLKCRDFSAEGNYVQRARGFIYLEEDCDAPQFIRAWEAKHGSRFTCNEVYIDHRGAIGLR